MEELQALNSFRQYLSDDVLPKIERYRGDVLIDLQYLYDLYILKRIIPKQIIHYVRTYGTHIYVPGVSESDTGEYIAGAMSGWAKNTTVNVLNLVEGKYELTESVPFVEYWNRVPI